MTNKNVLIVGAGSGLSASLARLFAHEGMKVALAARDTAKLGALCTDIGAQAFQCDVSQERDVSDLFQNLDDSNLDPDVVVYNAGARVKGPISDLDPEAVKQVLLINAFGAFLVARQAAKRMLEAGSGALLFTGASAGVKGYPQSAPFAMGKFALRGLCQSLARELHPQNIHVAHFVIDGSIYSHSRGGHYSDPDKTLNPDEIARSYLNILQQDRSAWSWEIELRPWVENF
jgi:NAD(P)-dependent dehydrogenase (short-subunit alcohol dehydrogenase family)